MKKKIAVVLFAAVCAVACALVFVGCGEKKEINYLKVEDEATGKYVSELDLGTFAPDRLSEINAKLDGLKFVFEYYPDKSTANADMSKVKIKHFYSDGQGGTLEGAGIPTTLQNNTSYSVYYYYQGHEPTADMSDALCAKITFFISEN